MGTFHERISLDSIGFNLVIQITAFAVSSESGKEIWPIGSKDSGFAGWQSDFSVIASTTKGGCMCCNDKRRGFTIPRSSRFDTSQLA